jgi:hypothetical protein
VREPGDETLVGPAVEVELLAIRLARGRRRVGREEQLDGIPRNEEDQDERDQRDAEEDRYEREESLEGVPGQTAKLASHHTSVKLHGRPRK